MHYNTQLSAADIRELFGTLRHGKDQGYLPTVYPQKPCLNCGKEAPGSYCDYGCFLDHREEGYPKKL